MTSGRRLQDPDAPHGDTHVFKQYVVICDGCDLLETFMFYGDAADFAYKHKHHPSKHRKPKKWKPRAFNHATLHLPEGFS